jgi:drug/metabolite transporter (DMT)-like permease
LNYTYPVWANLFSVALGERPKQRFWVWLGLALAGVYLVIDPTVGSIGTGELAGLTSGVFAGAAVLCIKRLRQTDGELVIVASFSIIGLLVALPLALWSSTSREVWIQSPTIAVLLCVGVLSFLGHVYFTRGYKHTSIQLGTVLSLLVPVIAAVSGWLFLDEPLTPTFLAGGAMILVACAALGLSERATPKGS